MLNPTRKAKWIAALESGKYEQGKNALVNDNKYCCLGVWCEIAGLKKSYDDYFFVDTGDGWLKETYCDKIGLSYSRMKDLARMNDKGRDFKTIAQYLRDHPEI